MSLIEKLKASLLKARKSVSDEKLQKVISILAPIYDHLIWFPYWTDARFLTGYSLEGRCANNRTDQTNAYPNIYICGQNVY